MKTNTVKKIISKLLGYGVTQEQIAEASGLSQGRISQIHKSPDGVVVSCAYENGKRLEEFLLKFESSTESLQ